MIRIAVLPGDGIGPEVTAAAVEVLRTALAGTGVEFEEGLVGGAAVDAEGVPLPDATLELCRSADAALLGSVGGPRWDGAPPPQRPEKGLLGLRQGLGLFANLRPIKVLPALAAASPIRRELLHGVDILFVRELTGGIYFGGKSEGLDRAVDECVYTAAEVERVARIAFQLAQQRRGRVTSVDKANVLATSRLWRATVEKEHRENFITLGLEHLLVDAMAMHLLQRPADFDVVVTENLFGDVLSDEASVLAGSIGLLPSASLGPGGFGLYEPVHGSAPDLAGKGVADPYGAILSAAMLLRHSLSMHEAADAVEAAVEAALLAGARTPDLGGKARTADVTEAVAAGLRA